MTGSISMKIVEAVARASQTPADDLPPLYEAVDGDALDALFANGRKQGTVTLEYAGYLVSVEDGAVDVSPLKER